VGINALEIVFINDGRHGLFALLVKAAHNAPSAVHQDIGVGSQHGCRQHDAEADDGAYRKRGVHVEHHTAGGYIGGLGKMFTGIRRADRDGELQRKANCASKIYHPVTSAQGYITALRQAKDYFGFRRGTMH